MRLVSAEEGALKREDVEKMRERRNTGLKKLGCDMEKMKKGNMKEENRRKRRVAIGAVFVTAILMNSGYNACDGVRP